VRSRKQKKTIRNLYRTVKNDLRDKIGSITGLSQADIARTYLRLPPDNDGLKRNEDTFNKVVWPKLEEERKRDRQIKTFERM
jgi:hypothetical protein